MNNIAKSINFSTNHCKKSPPLNCTCTSNPSVTNSARPQIVPPFWCNFYFYYFRRPRENCYFQGFNMVGIDYRWNSTCTRRSKKSKYYSSIRGFKVFEFWVPPQSSTNIDPMSKHYSVIKIKFNCFQNISKTNQHFQLVPPLNKPASSAPQSLVRHHAKVKQCLMGVNMTLLCQYETFFMHCTSTQGVSPLPFSNRVLHFICL